MKLLMARIASWLFRKMQGADLFLALRDLRSRGHGIDSTATFGPRVQLQIDASSSCRIGAGTEVLHDSWLITHPGDTMDIGSRVFISQHCTVSGSVRIGDDTLIGGFVTIIDGNHVTRNAERSIREQGGKQVPIEIGSDVWIGSNAVILQGVNIGDHAVVAANATVTKDVPEYAVVAGTPARVIRDRREER